MNADRLSTLRERQGSVQRELETLSASKGRSDNAALEDLESALMRELSHVERQINQIKAYLNRCESVISRE